VVAVEERGDLVTAVVEALLEQGRQAGADGEFVGDEGEFGA
jgi:hypothetical protein